MPTTRSRPRATKEPSVQKLEEKLEHVEKNLEKLHEGLERNFKAISEDFNELADSHDVLWDWHKRHCDTHKAALIAEPKEPSLLRDFVEVFAEFLGFGVGASLCAVLLIAVAFLFDALIRWVERR